MANRTVDCEGCGVDLRSPEPHAPGCEFGSVTKTVVATEEHAGYGLNDTYPGDLIEVTRTPPKIPVVSAVHETDTVLGFFLLGEDGQYACLDGHHPNGNFRILWGTLGQASIFTEEAATKFQRAFTGSKILRCINQRTAMFQYSGDVPHAR